MSRSDSLARMMIAVLGPGGVGGFIGAALARARGEVVIVAREPTTATIAAGGIEVKSVRIGDFVARPGAVAALRQAVDVLIVSTKATALDVALERIETQPDLVVPLLNGVDHMARLRSRFPHSCVAAGVSTARPLPGRARAVPNNGSPRGSAGTRKA